MKTKLLAAGTAVMLSAGAALAAPATVSADLNMRSGPGTQYGVVATMPAGTTVDVGGCTGSWCAVSFRGRSGYASANYLSGGVAMAPSIGVVVEPEYGPDYAYGDDYYNGYSYGPSIGFYAGPRWRGRPGWHGQRSGNWQGRPGWQGQRSGWQSQRSGWQGQRSGSWQGRPGWQGGSRIGDIGNQPTGAARIGNAGRTGGGQMSAPAGLRGGGTALGAGGGDRTGGGAARYNGR